MQSRAGSPGIRITYEARHTGVTDPSRHVRGEVRPTLQRSGHRQRPVRSSSRYRHHRDRRTGTGVPGELGRCVGPPLVVKADDCFVAPATSGLRQLRRREVREHRCRSGRALFALSDSATRTASPGWLAPHHRRVLSVGFVAVTRGAGSARGGDGHSGSNKPARASSGWHAHESARKPLNPVSGRAGWAARCGARRNGTLRRTCRCHGRHDRHIAELVSGGAFPTADVSCKCQ